MDDSESAKALVSCGSVLPAIVCLANGLEAHFVHDTCSMGALHETLYFCFRTTANGASRWTNS